MDSKIPVLEMPSYMRKTLSQPVSTLYVSDKPEIKGLLVDYSIGDIVSQNMRSKYKVVDGKTKRESVEKPRRIRSYIYVVNPRGTLSLNTRTMLKARSIEYYMVVGEEDLVTLGVGCEGEHLIVYGQPDTGVVLFKTDPYRVVNIIKTFKPNITCL